MMKSLVSILIPCFNAGNSIADTIRSALGQTWPHKEIIIVDDGSRDDSLAIARRFASKNVLVVTKENEGAAAARNWAFSLSQGHYIQWLDADDLLDQDKISKQMAAMEETGTDCTLFSSTWGSFVFRPDRAHFEITSLWADLSPVEWLLQKLEYNLFMQTATWLVSRQLTEAAGPWDPRLLIDDDGEYFSRVIVKSDGVRFVPGAKMFYRQSGPNGLSHLGRSDRKLEAHFLSMQLHIEYLRSLEESERVCRAGLAYLQRWLIYFYPERPDLVSQLRQLATDLGGHLELPNLSWKYAWIQKLFGWSVAKRTQLIYNNHKFFALRALDRLLFQLERGRCFRILDRQAISQVSP
jgi:glycosyltransferase involved in cell wall biosynthesis